MRAANVIIASVAVVVGVVLGIALMGQPVAGQQAPPPPQAAQWRYQTTPLQGQIHAFVVTDTQTGQVWGYQVGCAGWRNLGDPTKEGRR